MHPGWAGGKLNATSILIEPLGPEECGTLVANLLADDTVDDAVRTRIAEAAEGHPLYAEEITGLLVDEGRLVLKDGRWVATTDLSDVPVPPTISALLSARLDKLPTDERRLIEIASVMGQVFYASAVRAIAGGDPDAVGSGITSLVRKQFVRPERSDIPETEALAFRHLLMRDAAYDGISKATRAELHERFAGWLDAAAGSLGEQDEIVGYHLEQAYRYRVELGATANASGSSPTRLVDVSRRQANLRSPWRVRPLGIGQPPLSSVLVALSPDDRLRLDIMLDLGAALTETGEFEAPRRSSARRSSVP